MMDNHKFFVRILPASIRYLLAIVVISTCFFAVLRFAFLWSNQNDALGFFDPLFLQCFLVGWKFDMVVLAYVLALPILFITIAYVFPVVRIPLIRISTWMVSIGLSISCFAAIADIPYFQFFKNRLTVDALQWMNTPATVFSMIVSNTMHLFFLILGIGTALTFGWILQAKIGAILNRCDWHSESRRFGRGGTLAVFIIAGFTCFLGMRGKLTHPIRPGDAFYCTNPLLNQGALNPVFTFMKSMSNKVRLMDDEQALSQTIQYLGLGKATDSNSKSPFFRTVDGDSLLDPKPHVVLVLMEGMAASFMGQFGNTKGLTPVLDSLAGKSLFFENAFSAGIHTNNGVFSTLYGFPALKRVRPMSAVPVRRFTGMPYALKARGYRNDFFCSHNREFDNLGNFIPNNHYDALYTQEDFPQEASIGPYGVPDGYLFNRLIDHLDTATAQGSVFATVLTASNHDPYVIPEDFRSAQENKEYRAIQYADYAIGAFMAKAATKPWFNNTIFIFVADHGRVYGSEPYDLQFSFSHIPILFYAPQRLSSQRHRGFIGQVDVFPTLMGLLGGPYLNNTVGIDVLKQPRQAAYFSQDDKIGCVNDRWLYVYRFGGKESLYDYRNGSLQDFAAKEQSTLGFLRNYALSQTQAAEYVISMDLTGHE